MPNLPHTNPRWARGDVGREIGAWILSEIKEQLQQAGINGRKIDGGHITGVVPAAVTKLRLFLDSINVGQYSGLNFSDNFTAAEDQFPYVDGNDAADIDLANTGVAAGAYGDASFVPVLTIDAKGRVTSAGEVEIVGGGGGGTLDDLTDVAITTPISGDVLTYSPYLGQWVNEPAPAIPSVDRFVAQYFYSATTTMADPGAGNLRTNTTGSPGTVTQAAIDRLDDTGRDMSNVIRSMQAGDQIYAQVTDDASRWSRVTLTAAPTDMGGWWRLDVEAAGSEGVVTNGQEIVVTFVLSSGGGSAAGDLIIGTDSSLLALSTANSSNVIDLSALDTPGILGGITNLVLRNNVNTEDNLIIWDDGYVDIRRGLAVLNGGSYMSNSGTSLVLNTDFTFSSVRSIAMFTVAGVASYQLGITAANEFALVNAAGDTANVTVTDLGNMTVRGSLTVGGTLNAPHHTTHEPGGTDPMAVDAAAAIGSLRTLGTSATSAAAGNDARLTDSRAPSGAASGHLTGTYPGPSIASGVVTDAHVAAANKDGVAGTVSMRTLGTGAAQAAAGNHGHTTLITNPMTSVGDIIVGGASGAPTRLAISATNELLTVVGGTLAYTGSPTIPGVLTLNGNLVFGATAQRIVGDFNNATLANRVMFQSSATNASTTLSAIASGTGNSTQLILYAGSDPLNAASFTFTASQSGHAIGSTSAGSGSVQPLSFNVGSPGRMRMHVSGGISLLDITDPGAGVVRIAGALSTTGAITTSLTTAGTTLGLTNADAGTLGVRILTTHNSASPLANDQIFSLSCWGNDSIGTNMEYGRFRNLIVDPTDGVETSSWVFTAMNAGSLVSLLTLSPAGSTLHSGDLTLSGMSLGGNLTFTGTGRRILGDLSNATHANRVLFQTVTANSQSNVGVFPSGTGTVASFIAYNTSSPDAASFARFGLTSTVMFLDSQHLGATSTLPIEIRIDATTRARFHMSGGVSLLDTTDPGAGIVLVAGALRVAGALGTGVDALTLQNTTAAGFVGIHGISAGAIHLFFLTGYNASAAGNNSFGVAAPNTVELTTSVPLYVGPYTANPLALGTNGVVRMTVDSGGKVFIGATTTTADLNGVGLCINPGASAQNALVLKTPSLAHGITSFGETNTYGQIGTYSFTAGRLFMQGYGSATGAIWMWAVHVTDDTSHGLTSRGAYDLNAYLRTGTSITSVASGANVLTVETNGENLAIFSRPGDLYLNATSNINAFDDQDDAAMGRALRASIRPAGDPLRARFGGLIARYKPLIQQAGLVDYNDDATGAARGVPFINVGRISMFSLDAIWQLSERLAQQADRIAALEARLALNGG